MNGTMVEIKFLDEELYRVVGNSETGEEGGFRPPQYATQASAAVDLIAADTVRIAPGETVLVGTGIAIHMLNPEICAMILPRSGLGSKGLVLGNLVGLIDADYQGELKIAAWNRNESDFNGSPCFTINRGDRIAQMVFVPVMRAVWQAVKEFSVKTDRGEGGFGSTG